MDFRDIVSYMVGLEEKIMNFLMQKTVCFYLSLFSFYRVAILPLNYVFCEAKMKSCGTSPY